MESKLMTPEEASCAYYQRHIDAESRAALRAIKEGRSDHAGLRAKVAAHNARGIIEGACSCGEWDYQD